MIMRKPLSQDEIEEMRERLDLSTPGPWYAYLEKSVMSASDETVVAHCPDIAQQPSRFNSEFIACAKQDMPRLLDELDEYRLALEGLLSIIEEDAKGAILDINFKNDDRVRRAFSLLGRE